MRGDGGVRCVVSEVEGCGRVGGIWGRCRVVWWDGESVWRVGWR